jgi:putative ABC transport system permease protein
VIFLTLPWRNLKRRPVRTALTIAGIAVAIANYVAMIALAKGIPYSIEHSFDETGADFVVSERNAYMIMSGSVPEGLGAKLSQTPGVADIAPVLFNVMSADDQANVVVVGWLNDSALWKTVTLLSGRLPRDGEQDGLVLGDTIATNLDKKIGDSVDLKYRPFKVIGIAKFNSILNENLAVVNLKTLQSLLGRADTVSLFEIILRRPIDLEAAQQVRSAIARMAPDFAVQDTGDLARNLTLLKLIVSAATAISFVAVLVAVLGVANTLIMAINERIGEIGILRAIGWSSERVVTAIGLEGLLISSIGGIVGIGLGVLTVRVVAGFQIAFGLLDPRITPALLGQALGLAILAGMVGSMFAARRAIRISPADAIRHV